MEFRKAELRDTDTLTALINSAYRGDSARAGWTYESDLVDGVRITSEEIHEIIRKDDEFYLVLEDDKKLVGCAHVRVKEDAFFIGMLTVKPDLQNAGIGSKLLAELEKRAKAAGKKFTRLDVIHVRSELIAYYERKGYIRTGFSEPFPSQYPAKIAGLRLIELKKTL